MKRGTCYVVDGLCAPLICFCPATLSSHGYSQLWKLKKVKKKKLRFRAHDNPALANWKKKEFVLFANFYLFSICMVECKTWPPETVPATNLIRRNCDNVSLQTALSFMSGDYILRAPWRPEAGLIGSRRGWPVSTVVALEREREDLVRSIAASSRGVINVERPAWRVPATWRSASTVDSGPADHCTGCGMCACS